ncbi:MULTISPECIES: hypothetical protein [unclassified Enterococcus]|uniref:hypothetical protein n=1 Tax=unclassified Enterococcus TaxID=2608891 RepID=UPI001554B2A0|nr:MULTISPECIES: hypothetical protein [unclassified Enterococcus]MBS7576340.1 hypothetical protein [Enterococcus sp. MMGLQ5-2]MBS7583572.1 hypothetical protein [Enterococcus sp. MMGLQ5-1]NPD11434.1 hypothetical protein [Enterococcus sp. MMGLQ5-1]NPD36178.1 hypothetical protein [Enterococcus sp. MMGLQ5-2]
MSNKVIKKNVDSMFKHEETYINARIKRRKKSNRGRWVVVFVSIIMGLLVIGTILYSFIETIYLNN